MAIVFITSIYIYKWFVCYVDEIGSMEKDWTVGMTVRSMNSFLFSMTPFDTEFGCHMDT